MRNVGVHGLRMIAAAAVILAVSAAAQAAVDERCSVPDFIVTPESSMPRAASSVRRNQRLDILLLSGSPTQTGAAKGLKSYPTFFEQALHERLPGVEIRLTVRVASRRSAIEVLPQIPEMLAELKPALVIWQAGTVESLRGIPPDELVSALEQGAALAARGGADVILLNMQYSPRMAAIMDSTTYTQNMRRVVETLDISMFDRFEIMRYWNESGAFDLSSTKNDGLFERIHLCLGWLLADYVLRGAALTNYKGTSR
jgi:hypothetical protein